MRRGVLLAAVVVVVAVGMVLSGALGGTVDEPTADVPEESLVAVDGEHELWPYTSRHEAVDGRTLAINVVFRDDGDAVRDALTGDVERDWEETDEGEQEHARPDTARRVVTRDWEVATGSARYSYTRGPDGSEWVEPSFEVHDGTYLGARDHVRAYESPSGAYTAVQVHEEYYDWLRLRHTVTGIDDPATRMEDEFIAADAAVTREYRGISGGWSDGWLTVIELAVLVPLGGALLRSSTRAATATAARRLVAEGRRHVDAAVLGAALAATFLGVRTAGVSLEVAYPGLTPKTIAAPLYLVVAVGLPAVAVAAADDCEPAAAFLGAVVGLGGGFVLDFAGLGVAVPPDLIVHRTAVLATIGLVAAGSAGDDRGALAVGLGAWAVGLMLPLAGVV